MTSMISKATAVNPTVLIWARQQCGLSVDDVALSLKREPEEIRAWEAGRDYPTFVQLEHLADRYKRPVALFFFPAPPPEPVAKREFRTLPTFELANLQRDTLLAFREALAFQDSLSELTEDKNPAPRKLFVELRASPTSDPRDLARRARALLGVSLDEQTSWKSARQGFERWRDALELAGVFVFKRALKQKEISGFCLTHDEFPVILVNNSTALTRQIFTMFHEFAHILFSVSGVTKSNDEYIDHLPPKQQRIEAACNRFGAELLVPDADFVLRVQHFSGIEAEVGALADTYNVSREVVLRRLLSMNLVDRDTYNAWTSKWNSTFDHTRSSDGGGNYYATQATYLGRSFLRLAFTAYFKGRCTLEDLASHLHMKSKNVENLEQYALG